MSSGTYWSDFWHDRWQRGQIGFHQDETEDLLKKFFPVLTRDAQVLVPLCGKSKDLLFFSERGHQVVGVELSEIACEEFFKENSLPFEKTHSAPFTVYAGELITLYCGDFFEFKANFIQKLGFIYDRAALIALPPELRKKYVKHLVTLVEQTECLELQMLLIAIAYDQTQKKGPPFSVNTEEIGAHYQHQFTVEKLLSEADSLGTLPIIQSAYRLTLKR